MINAKLVHALVEIEPQMTHGTQSLELFEAKKSPFLFSPVVFKKCHQPCLDGLSC